MAYKAIVEDRKAAEAGAEKVREAVKLAQKMKCEEDEARSRRSRTPMTEQKQAPERYSEDYSGLVDDPDGDYIRYSYYEALAKQRDKLDRQVRAWMKACDIRRESGEKLSRENRELEIRAEKAEAERDELAEEVEGLKVARDMMGRLWGKAKAERDQALAASAAREIAMRDRVIKAFRKHFDKPGPHQMNDGGWNVVIGHSKVESLPFSPDGQQALDDVRAEEWEAGYAKGADDALRKKESKNPYRQPSRSSDAVKSEDRG